jgi:Holliday junction resolvase
MSTPEYRVKQAVKKMLETSNVYFFFPSANGYGHAGIPDIIAAKNGHFIGIECKAGKGKTTALQERELQKIRDAGGTALVIREDNMDELQEALDAH